MRWSLGFANLSVHSIRHRVARRCIDLARVPVSLVAILVAFVTCILPTDSSNPTPSRLQFVVPSDTFLIEFGALVTPPIHVQIDGEAADPPLSYRLETADQDIVTVDTSGRLARGGRLGATRLRVVLQNGAAGAVPPDTSFPVKVTVAGMTLPRSLDSLTALGDTLLIHPGYLDANGAHLGSEDSARATPRIELVSTGRAVLVDSASGAVVAHSNGVDTIRAVYDTSVVSLVVVVRQKADSLSIQPRTIEFRSIDEVRQLLVSAWDRRGNPIAAPGEWWGTPDTATLTLTPTGLARARSNGTAVIRVVCDQVRDSIIGTIQQVPQRLREVSGANQVAIAGAPLPLPFVTQLVDSLGSDVAFAGASVRFDVLQGGGSFAGADSAVLSSDASGRATVTLIAGTSTATQTANASLAALADSALTFSASVLAAAPAAIEVDAGQAQTDTIGAVLTTAISARVSDAYGNRVSGVAVRFDIAGGAGSVDDTLAITDANGVAASQWTLGDSAGVQTVRATISAVPGPVALFQATATPGAATTGQSLVTVSDTEVASGLTVLITVETRDRIGTPLTTGGRVLTFDSHGGSSRGTFGPTTDLGNGRYTATFLGTTAGTPTTIDASIDGALITTPTPAVLVVPGAASPSRSMVGVADAVLAAGSNTTLSLQAVDAAGNLLTSGGLAVGFATSGGGSTGSIGATVDQSDGTYTATFTGLAAGTATTIQATIDGVPVTSTLPIVTVLPAGATSLGFQIGGQPSTTTAGASIAPVIRVAILDASGNLVPGASAPITIALATNPGGAVLFGTLTRQAVNGVATFDDLSVVLAANGYTLQADAGTLTAAISDPFAINAAAPAKLHFESQPPSAVAGVALSPAIQVEVQDVFGNLVSSATNPVTLNLGANPGGSTLSGTTIVGAVAGVATFSAVSLDKVATGYTLLAAGTNLAGATSAAFSVAPGAPAVLVLTAEPGTGVVGQSLAPAPQIRIEDGYGNRVTTSSDPVTLSLVSNPAGGILAGTTTVNASSGIATFTAVSLDLAGTGYTVRATLGGLASPASAPFSILGAPSVHLEFIAEPTSAVAGVKLNPVVRVAIVDSLGIILTGRTDNVTVALSPGTGTLGANLRGTLTIAAIGGVATFSTLSVDSAGLGYALGSAATGMTGATSATFAISPAPPHTLAFIATPVNTAANTTLPAVQVAVLDSLGNRTTNQVTTVNMTLTGGSSAGAALAGTTARATVAGVASFGDLSVNHANAATSPYGMLASLTSVPSAASPTFQVTVTLIAVSAGTTHSCGITATNDAYCWGANQSVGALGTGSLAAFDSTTPQPVTGGLKFTAVSVGLAHTCALATSGAVYCWGESDLGRLGALTALTDQAAPIAVSGGLTFKAVDAGDTHTCALITSGAAYCWGDGSNGRLGNGLSTTSLVPVAVSGGTTYQSLGTGGSHTCAVATDGTGWCWGLGTSGRLGTGNNSSQSVPAAVTGGLTYISVSAGAQHTCAVRTNGLAYCWGRGTSGRIGDGGTSNRTAPTAVSGGHTYTAVSAGGEHTCGRRTDGVALCWGSNASGQLGIGNLSVTSSATPSAVVGGNAYDSVSAGALHSGAVVGSGSGSGAYGWGSGTNGRLGNGATAIESAPVRVAKQP